MKYHDCKTKVTTTKPTSIIRSLVQSAFFFAAVVTDVSRAADNDVTSFLRQPSAAGKIRSSAMVVGSDNARMRKHAKVHVLIYETEADVGGPDSPAQRLVDQLNRIGSTGEGGSSISASIFGQDGYFAGYGSKFSAVLPILDEISRTTEVEDPLVVVSDSRDVLVNFPYEVSAGNEKQREDVVNEFLAAFDHATYGMDEAIVISAEAQCCVSALTHVPLGGYYHKDGSRNEYACSSGGEGCLWAGDDKAEPWENFMKTLMLERTNGIKLDDAYLNAGLMVGRVSNMRRVLSSANIRSDEDDQAVLTDYMYHHPKEIVLDYHQTLFGNNRGGLSATENTWQERGQTTQSTQGCVFEKRNSARLVHIQTMTLPLFIHSPGGYFTCHDQMSDSLKIPKVTAQVRRRLNLNDMKRKLQSNYGRTPVAGPTASAPTSSLLSRPVASPESTPVVAPTSSLLDRLSSPTAAAPTSSLLDRLSSPVVPAPTMAAPLAPVSSPTVAAPTVAAPTVAETTVAAPTVVAPTSSLLSRLTSPTASAPVASEPVASAPVASQPTSSLLSRLSTPTVAAPASTVVTSPVDSSPVAGAPSVSTSSDNSLLSRLSAPTESLTASSLSSPTSSDGGSSLLSRLSSPTTTVDSVIAPTAAPVSTLASWFGFRRDLEEKQTVENEMHTDRSSTNHGDMVRNQYNNVDFDAMFGRSNTDAEKNPFS